MHLKGTTMPPHTIEPVDQQLMRKIRILNAASKRFLGVEAVVKIETQKAPGGRFYHAAVFRIADEPIVVAYGISEEDAITALEEILEAD